MDWCAGAPTTTAPGWRWRYHGQQAQKKQATIEAIMATNTKLTIMPAIAPPVTEAQLVLQSPLELQHSPVPHWESYEQ